MSYGKNLAGFSFLILLGFAFATKLAFSDCEPEKYIEKMINIWVIISCFFVSGILLTMIVKRK